MTGLGGELSQELDHLKHAANRAQQQGPITIRIPADHLDAERLKKLMETLANKIERPSGLVIDRAKIPNAEQIMLEELRKLGAPIPHYGGGEDHVPGVAAGTLLAVEELLNDEPHRVAGELAESQIYGHENK